MSNSPQGQKVPKWYFGGVATSMAVCFTHPLDLIKVQMQTRKGGNASIMEVVRHVLHHQGILGLYKGLTAAVLRQLTYSTSRFAIYEAAKQRVTAINGGKPPSFSASVLMAGLGGAVGGVVGNPPDLVNVRMQNDIKLPPSEKRNYKHVLDGIYQIATKESVTKLSTGVSMNISRAVVMNIGQLTFYDSFKAALLNTAFFEENVATHITASVLAGAVATTMCQPLDVLKTRVMSVKSGTKARIITIFISTAKEGPLAFFKGYVPAFTRLVPQTILTFVFLEQLRINFGDTKLTIK